MRILIGDDDRTVATALTTFVENCGYDVVATVTTGGLEVLHAYDRYRPDIVLLDVMMPRFNGFTICRAILSKEPEAKVILMSGRISPDHPFVKDSGAYAFMPKPLRFTKVRLLLDAMVPALAA